MLALIERGAKMPSLVFQSFGVWEALIILAIVVVLFGASRIADVGGAMGRAIRDFRRELKGPEEERKEVTKGEETTPKTGSPPGGRPFQH